MQSIKKAQQAAAQTAIKSTKYQHPPVKIKESDKALTPTVLLNNLAAKLGLAVSYKRVFDDIVVNIEMVVDWFADFGTKVEWTFHSFLFQHK